MYTMVKSVFGDYARGLANIRSNNRKVEGNFTLNEESGSLQEFLGGGNLNARYKQFLGDPNNSSLIAATTGIIVRNWLLAPPVLYRRLEQDELERVYKP